MGQYFTPQNIFDAFVALGGIAFVWAQVVKGRADKKSGDDKDALTTIKLKDEAIKALQDEQSRQGKEIIQLQTEMKVKDETIERYLQLLQNRNPELESFMKTTATSMLAIEKAIQGIQEVLLNIHKIQPSITVNNAPNAQS